MYRGRLAPSPTGYLHLGHARTFWTAQQRAVAAGGTLVLRNEDLDARRFRLEFVDAMMEDLRWFGFQWQEGPDCGGPFGPYSQSERGHFYRAALEKLRAGGLDLSMPLFAPGCFARVAGAARRGRGAGLPGDLPSRGGNPRIQGRRLEAKGANWRFRVPDGERISFVDGFFGSQQFQAGRDFGDFVVWRRDDVPSYQLAVVVDDAAMKITEVVRGADLLLSTARQLLLYRALELTPPAFYHCPLVTDDSGARLAKRHDALSLRSLRAKGMTPQKLRESW